jgi:diguanylate cyclase (GGDEF)-like protein
MQLTESAIAQAPDEMLEPHALPYIMLTAASVERARGNDAAAVAQLKEARRFAETHNAPEPAAQALKDLSELAARRGDFETAYTLLRQHMDEWARFQTERSELHAATLQAIYGADVERRRRLAVEQLADTDPLTSLWNRRFLDRQLGELAGRPMAVALLDLDHFKQVNDRFSHDAGDAVLRRLADLLRLEAGSDPSGSAFAARLGGEEFVLVLPAATGDVALRHCERIRTQMQASDWGPLAGRLVVTVSIGLALDLLGTAEASELLSRADAALYEAKRHGRNRVVAVSDAQDG